MNLNEVRRIARDVDAGKRVLVLTRSDLWGHQAQQVRSHTRNHVIARNAVIGGELFDEDKGEARWVTWRDMRGRTADVLFIDIEHLAGYLDPKVFDTLWRDAHLVVARGGEIVMGEV